jgi:hypothetical protein
MPMTNPIATDRHRIRRLAPVLGLLLLTVLFVSGTHHHPDGGHHTCVVCTVGHSPAVAANLATPTPAPTGMTQAIHAPLERAPRPTRLETAPSRAPPLA